MRTYLLIAVLMFPLSLAAAPDQINAPFEAFGYGSDEMGDSYLGVDTRDITPDRVAPLKLKSESGVEVTMVDQDAPAGKAGIKEQDVILTLNGAKVESVEQLRRMIHETPAGRTVTLGLSRNGQPLTVQAQLADRSHFRAGMPGGSFKVEMPHIPALPAMADMDLPVSVVVVHSAMRSGLMVENLTRQLGEYFGAKEGHGVLVRSVEKGSRADRAGFRAGDVIVRVDKNPVSDSSDFSHALQSHRSGGPVSVGIIRDKREQTLTLTLPERKEAGELFGEKDFDFPDVDAEIHLEDLDAEIAQVRPQIEFALRQAGRSFEQAKKSLCQQQKEFRNQQEKMRKQMREQNLKMKDEWKAREREIRRELFQLQRRTTQI